MRPPQNAGENRSSAWLALTHIRSFNEAPAKRGGKRGHHHELVLEPHHASMRPPQNAGENQDSAGGRIV